MKSLFCIAALLVTVGCALDTDVVRSAPSIVNEDATADWDTTDRLTRPATLDSLQNLAAKNPNSAISQRRLLLQAVQAEDKARALGSLEQMTALGLALSPAGYEFVGKLVGAEVVASHEQRGASLASAKVASIQVATIPATIPLSESFAFDPATGRYFTGSITDRSLHVSDDGFIWRWVATRALGSVAGLAIDPARGTLWIASGKLEQTKQPDTTFVGLVALDLETLREKRRVTAPPNIVTLGDLTVAPAGAVLVSDPLGSGVYRLGPGRGQLETLVEAGHLASPQGIVVHPSGNHAYVADWAYGIAIIELESRALKRLDAPTDLALDGVDGMAWHDDALVVIQNGSNPHRIVRWTLTEDGFAVRRATILERAHPDWGEPTVGQVVDDRFLYISDPQWYRFEQGGALKGDAPLRPNPIRALNLVP